jgi:hypothetical protein
MLQFRPPAATARDDTLGRLKPEAEAPRARPLRRPDVVMDQHHPIRAGAAIKLHVHLPKVVGAPRNRGERNDAHITLPSACLVPSPQCRLLEVPPAHPAVPARSVAEFIAYAKANPGKVTMASAGNNGAPSHLSGSCSR